MLLERIQRSKMNPLNRQSITSDSADDTLINQKFMTPDREEPSQRMQI
jgi:hypothetical protein